MTQVKPRHCSKARVFTVTNATRQSSHVAIPEGFHLQQGFRLTDYSGTTGSDFPFVGQHLDSDDDL